MGEIDWAKLRCRHPCSHPVSGLYMFPHGCLCFEDQIQALCAQHAAKGDQNNVMYVVVQREEGCRSCEYISK